MPLDAVCLQAVVAELFAPCRRQPYREDTAACPRSGGAAAPRQPPPPAVRRRGQPRLHLTELLRDNPAQPPMFCMLLRKYLSGGIIEKIEQIPLERVVSIHISAADELGERRRFPSF